MELRYPVGAVCSFAHRTFGALLALSLPVVIYLLRQSLQGPSDYAAAARLTGSIPAKIAAVLFIWALAHHALASGTLAHPAGYVAWRAWVLAGPMRLPALLFFTALFLHAGVGLRDGILDYVHPIRLRPGVLTLVAIGLAAMALAIAPAPLAA